MTTSEVLKLIWDSDNSDGHKNPYDYFCLMFPMYDVPDWIEKTNSRISVGLGTKPGLMFWGYASNMLKSPGL